MATQTGRRAGRRARLSRERVLRAAMAVADEGGLEALTMRTIGQRLGVEAMSLYRHVRDKEDTLDGIVDLVFGEIDLPPTAADWKTAMRQRAVSAREALTGHSWAIGLMESRARPGPANMRHHEAVLGTLRTAGFSTLNAVRAYNVVNSYVYGFALQELTLPFRTSQQQSEVSELILRHIPAGEYPHLADVATELTESGFIYAEEFEFGLDLILDGLEKMRLTN
jgi:AcrR family transcriptional regulator